MKNLILKHTFETYFGFVVGIGAIREDENTIIVNIMIPFIYLELLIVNKKK